MYVTGYGGNLAWRLEQNLVMITMSRDGIEWTLMNVEVLESAAQSIFLALSAGGTKELTLEAVRGLGEVMLQRNLPLLGAPGVNASLEALYFDGDGNPL